MTAKKSYSKRDVDGKKRGLLVHEFSAVRTGKASPTLVETWTWKHTDRP